jgi:hypothetical protein
LSLSPSFTWRVSKRWDDGEPAGFDQATMKAIEGNSMAFTLILLSSSHPEKPARFNVN